MKDIKTQLVHGGEPETLIEGAVCMPVFQSATFEYSGEGSYHDVRYIRLNNTPNHTVLHKKLALLERGEAALVLASGMAAISTALLSTLKAGDHLLAQNTLYGGTHGLLTKELKNFGIDYDFIDLDRGESWARYLKPNTKAIYVESISNPLMQVGNLEAVVEFAKNNNLVSLIDNTFTGPYNFCPLPLGFDLSLHSCTKSLNGHSDIVAGAIIGSRKFIDLCAEKAAHLGGSLDPHACFLLHRGIKTLALRMDYQNRLATEIAAFLASHPAVEKVNYPGLKSHPHYDRAQKLFRGCGGVLSFEIKGGIAAATAFTNKVKLSVSAPSLGGVESLVTCPVHTSHAGLSADERQAAGISPGLVRVSLGIEAAEDLKADFNQALDS